MLKESPIWDFLDSWQTPNCYSSQFAPLPKGSGIYLLVLAFFEDGVLDHRILYVGMSRNIANRFINHEVKKACQRDFPSELIKVYFKRYPSEVLRRRERRLIKQINPPYNLQHRQKGF